MGPSTCFCREYCIASPIFCGAHVLQLAVKAISRLLRDTSIGEARFGKRAVFSFWHCSLGGFQALCLWNFFFSSGLPFFLRFSICLFVLHFLFFSLLLCYFFHILDFLFSQFIFCSISFLFFGLILVVFLCYFYYLFPFYFLIKIKKYF